MSLLYSAAFDISTLGSVLGTITLTRAASSNAVVTYSAISDTQVDGSGTAIIFFHHPFDVLNANKRVEGQDPDETVKFGHYSRRAFGWALRDAMRTAATSAGWADPTAISVVCDNTTGFYTVSIAGSIYSIGIQFSTTAGANMISFSGNSASATSHTGTVTPRYVINPTVPAVSDPTPNYEPRGIANRAEADDGTGFGLARSVSPLYRDWRQEFETKEKTLRISAASTHPWTFQHLFEHCRGQLGFALINQEDTIYEAFSLRSEGTQFEAQRATPGNDAQFHLGFNVCVEGSFETFTP